MFKIGDCVVVRGYTGGKRGIVDGLVGVVTSINELHFPIKVKFATLKNDSEIFNEKELRHDTKLDRILK